MAKDKDKKKQPVVIPQRPSDAHAQTIHKILGTPSHHVRVDQKTTTTAYIFHSPVPPPEEMAKFNQAVPNGGDRILRMAEKEQDHRHGQERADVADTRRGMNYAFIISLVTIVGGFVTINLGSPITGTIFAGGGLVSVITLFIQGRATLQKNKAGNGEASGTTAPAAQGEGPKG